MSPFCVYWTDKIWGVFCFCFSKQPFILCMLSFLTQILAEMKPYWLSVLNKCILYVEVQFLFLNKANKFTNDYTGKTVNSFSSFVKQFTNLIILLRKYTGKKTKFHGGKCREFSFSVTSGKHGLVGYSCHFMAFSCSV